MLHKILIRTIAIYALIACTIFFGGGVLYLVSIAIAGIIILITRLHDKRLLIITRWANKNAMKARIAITIIQALLLMSGLYLGFNLNRAGYSFPGSAAIAFALVMIIGFLYVPFLPVRKLVPIPKQVNSNRMAFLGIALSFFMMMVLMGNQMESRYPHASLTRGLAHFDELIFSADVKVEPDEEYESGINKNDQPSGAAVFAALSIPKNESFSIIPDPEKDAKAKLKAEKKAKKLEKKKAKQLERIKKRMGLSAALTGGAVLLIILLVATTCAGVCLIIAGFSGSAGLIPLGILVAGGSIYGIIQVAKKNKRKQVEP